MCKNYLFVILLGTLTACSGLTQKPAEVAVENCPVCPKCTDINSVQNTGARNDIPAGSNPIPATEPILDYIGRFSSLSAEEQKKELAQINENLSLNKLDFNYRMKAMVIYAIPGTRLRDIPKAQAFVDGLMREKTLDPQRKVLAGLLRDYITDNARQVQENNRLQQENNRLFLENITLAQKNRDEQKRADTLQQTLDELKAIEKSLIDREQGLRK